MDQLQRLLAGQMGGAAPQGPGIDSPLNDTSEQIHISSLALLKMLKHGINPNYLNYEFVNQGELVCRWRLWD